MQAKNENGYWVFPIPSETFGSNLFIVETDNAVTLTNDDNAANELVSRKKFSYALDNDDKNLVSSNPFSIRLNLNPNDMPQGIAEKLRTNSIAFNALNEFEKITMASDGLKSNLTVKMKDGEENSLFRLFQMIDKAVMN